MGKDERDPRIAALRVDPFQVPKACAVNRGYALHSQHDAVLAGFFRNLQDLIGRAEEQRAAELVNGSIFRNRLICFVFGSIIPLAQFGGVAHALHEKHACEDEPNFDCDHKVEHDRERKREHEDENIALRRCFDDADELPPFAHVVGDHEKNCGDRRHGDQSGIRHQHNEDKKQHDCVYDADHRRAAAVLYVRCRTGNCARCGDAAEECGADVANALRHKFHVGVMF